MIENSTDISTILNSHAIVQAKRRGISLSLISLLYEYGEEQFDNHGCYIRYFNQKRLKKLLGNSYTKYEKEIRNHLNIYLVESHEGVIITVGHRLKRRKEKPSQKYSSEYHLKKHFTSGN